MFERPNRVFKCDVFAVRRLDWQESCSGPPTSPSACQLLVHILEPPSTSFGIARISFPKLFAWCATCRCCATPRIAPGSTHQQPYRDCGQMNKKSRTMYRFMRSMHIEHRGSSPVLQYRLAYQILHTPERLSRAHHRTLWRLCRPLFGASAACKGSLARKMP